MRRGSCIDTDDERKDGCGHVMYWGWNLGPGGWLGPLVGGIVWLIIVALVVVLIVRLVSGPRGVDRSMPGPDDPEETLRARFARGEIGQEEFEQRLEVLRRTRPMPPAQK